jgi:hypothetical protein
MLRIDEDTQGLVDLILEAQDKIAIKYEEVKQEVINTTTAVINFARSAKEFFDWVQNKWREGIGGAGGESLRRSRCGPPSVGRRGGSPS